MPLRDLAQHRDVLGVYSWAWARHAGSPGVNSWSALRCPSSALIRA